jgi:hypothetical protein
MGTWCTVCNRKDDTWDSYGEPIRDYFDEVICPDCWAKIKPQITKIIEAMWVK